MKSTHTIPSPKPTWSKLKSKRHFCLQVHQGSENYLATIVSFIVLVDMMEPCLNYYCILLLLALLV